MAVQVSYPGVYIQEAPSGVRTITGVPTSVAAFVGRTRRGEVDTPVVITSYADFERRFGGLWRQSTLSFAVRDFYLNGGGQAVIVRLYRDAGVVAVRTAVDVAVVAGEGTPNNAQPAEVAAAIRAAADAAPEGAPRTAAQAVATAAENAAGQQNATRQDVLTAARAAVDDAVAENEPVTRARLDLLDANDDAALLLEAISPGTWGNRLRARVDRDVSPALLNSPLLTDQQKALLFNLSVRDDGTGEVEQFRNLTLEAGRPRSVDRVLSNESRLVRVRAGDVSGEPVAAHANPPVGRDVWADPEDQNDPPTNTPVADAGRVGGDGTSLEEADFTGPGTQANKRGLYALDDADIFNLLCLPPLDADNDIPAALIGEAARYCERRRAMLLVDPPLTWRSTDAARQGVDNIGTRSNHAAVFFPRLAQPNPLSDNQIESFVPCGAVAGVFARTDAQRGVWKAPAGLEATLVGVPALSVPLTDGENGLLNPLGVNCLRVRPAAGRVVWGARTLEGDDRLASEWKYIPVRRLALFIEESLFRGTQWIVFEPNDEPLWAQIRLNVGAFMQNLFRQGAFAGRSPRDAYLVKCDAETTTQNDRNLGIVNIVVGFAPLKPAEFVIITIRQLAGQIQT